MLATTVVHEVGHVVVHGGRLPDMSDDRLVIDDRDGCGWAAEVLDGRALRWGTTADDMVGRSAGRDPHTRTKRGRMTRWRGVGRVMVGCVNHYLCATDGGVRTAS